MVGDPLASDRAPDLQSVLDALDDPDCRTIVETLSGPMTAKEIAAATGIPQSTTYRKLDRLSEASILAEETVLRPDGHHTTTYRVDFEEVRVSFDDDRDLDVRIERPARSPDRRLADLWSEVQKQT